MALGIATVALVDGDHQRMDVAIIACVVLSVASVAYAGFRRRTSDR
jgi:multisubunit Na+/H+ antiporter MnhF subunit